jgi:hypothetical protein
MSVISIELVIMASCFDFFCSLERDGASGPFFRKDHDAPAVPATRIQLIYAQQAWSKSSGATPCDCDKSQLRVRLCENGNDGAGTPHHFAGSGDSSRGVHKGPADSCSRRPAFSDAQAAASLWIEVKSRPSRRPKLIRHWHRRPLSGTIPAKPHATQLRLPVVAGPGSQSTVRGVLTVFEERHHHRHPPVMTMVPFAARTGRRREPGPQ